VTDLELAERAARVAGELLLERFGAPAREVEVKSSSTDMVSAADRAAEDAIAELLRAERPEDGLLGEEGASVEGASGRRWVIDPLDGTTNFLYGIPQWAVSVALEDSTGPLVGVVFNPPSAELFRAERGGGCSLGRIAPQKASTSWEPLRIRPCTDLSRSLLATGFGYDPERRRVQAQAIAHVLPRVRDIRRAGAAALDLAWLAAGRLDGYWERGLEPWDWSAGRLLVTEAGGAIADLDGDPHGLAAASPTLLPELLALVSEAERAAT
jgi:myo-inositol-1(or 4)-monophosphatase